jgi:hypothetical protein
MSTVMMLPAEVHRLSTQLVVYFEDLEKQPTLNPTRPLALADENRSQGGYLVFFRRF